VSAKVSVELLAKFRRTLPPTFLFLLYSIFKEPAMVKPPPNFSPKAKPASLPKTTAQKPSPISKPSHANQPESQMPNNAQNQNQPSGQSRNSVTSVTVSFKPSR
jgi:hypothetical protein